MTYLTDKFQPPYVDIRKGLVPGHAIQTIRAHNESATTTRTVVGPTMGTATIDQSAIHAAADTVWVASTSANDTNSSGTHARKVLVYGLDASGDVASEAVNLAGQTAVETTGTWTAIHDIVAYDFGATRYNEGTMWVGEGSFAAGVPATKYFAGEPQSNFGYTGYYTVPTGKALLILDITAGISAAAKDCDVFIETSTDNGATWYTLAIYGMVSEAMIQRPITSQLPVAAGNHIRIACEATASGTDVHVYLNGLLYDV